MSTPARSVFRLLVLRLGVVVIIAASLLLMVVMQEYGFSVSDFTSSEMWSVSIPEVIDHVLIPLALIAVPMIVVVAWAISSAFAPFHRVANSVESSLGRERGFRLSLVDIPLETLPFVKAVNALLARLDEAAQRHEAFAADVAHELRRSLAVISLQVDRAGTEVAGDIKRGLGEIRRLIDQLMLLARADAAAAAHFSRQELSLRELATQAVTDAAPAIIGAKRVIELEAENSDLTILGHQEAILAALQNLIENALRVTPVGRTIVVVVGPGAVIKVRDAGPGLSSERLSQLVKRFVRSENASHQGAGLGLSIVDRIMIAHGGTLATDAQRRELILRFPLP